MLSAFFPAAVFAASTVSGGDGVCRSVSVSATPYTICSVAQTANIRLFLRDEDGEIYGDFDAVNATLATEGERLVFAMNAGMYHDSRAPVGLYLENGQQQARLNTNLGPGNFHMLPNGVMFQHEAGWAVLPSEAFAQTPQNAVPNATQSGPMLVIEGTLHPRFTKGSANRRIRNGVGVDRNGTLYFVKSERPVNFWDFASLFRDTLDAPNALYLDGTISRLYATGLGRNDEGLPMGPIIGLVEDVK